MKEITQLVIQKLGEEWMDHLVMECSDTMPTKEDTENILQQLSTLRVSGGGYRALCRVTVIKEVIFLET